MNVMRRVSIPLVCIAFAALSLAAVLGRAAEEGKADESNFARTTIDVGMVVSNAEKSAEFYTKAFGFKEIEGFDVPKAMGADSGLTDNLPVHVRVLVLGDGESAAKLKLLEFPGVKSKTVDNGFIHSSLGLSYLTIFVKDTTAALEQAKKHGAVPRAKGPFALPKGFPEGVYLSVFSDPDGNLVEIVGPKK